MVREDDSILMKSLLKITTERYSLDEKLGCLDHLEQIGCGDVSTALVNLVKHSMHPCIRALSIHALFTWIQRWPRACDTLVDLDVIPALLDSLFPTASMKYDVAMHSASAASGILGYLIEGRHGRSEAFLEQMVCHNGAGKVLAVCCSPQHGSVVCMALDLLKKLTKLSPRIFESIMQQNGPSIVAGLLRTYKRHQDVVKYATLLLARWSAIPGIADRLESTSVFESLWEVITTMRGYDSKIYAYAVCGICVLSVDRVERLCSLLVRQGTNDMAAFCSAIEHYDECFQNHSVVHHTIWQAVSSAYGERIVVQAARLGLLDALAKWETNEELILEVIASLAESKKDYEESDAILASFLVKKMPQFPEETVQALFSAGSLVDALVKQAFHDIVREREESHPTDVDEGSDLLLDTDMMLTSEPSAESLALLVEDHDTKGCQPECQKATHRLGDACFEAFAGENIFVGSTVVLCKVMDKLREKMEGSKHEEEEPATKKFKTSTRDIHDMVTFRIGGASLSVPKDSIRKESRVVSLLLEDDDSDIEIPTLHHLSTKDAVCAFRRIFEWCKTRDIPERMSLGDISCCWIAADYLDMSDEFTNYLFNQKVEPRLCTSTTQGRAHVYTWLSSLCRMFLGAESLYRWAARCMIYEFGKCHMSLDGMPNLESLKEFAQLDGMSTAVTAHLRIGFS